MKKCYLIKLLLLLIGTSCVVFTAFSQNMPQIENAGFEQWEGSGDSIEPVHWNSFMNTECTNPFYLSLLLHKQVEASTDVRPGSNGTTSARIFARDASLMGYTIIANGNLTTGRIYAQEVDLNLAGNKTKRNETGFNHPFTATPDSITFWVRNNCVSAQQNAYMKAIIHDNTDYFIPLSGLNDYEHAVGVATSLFVNEGNTWVRQSAAFDYESFQSEDPQYMLLFFNTNIEAAVGDPADEMFVDDVLLIYRPTVSVNTINPTTYVLDPTAGATISVPFTLTGTMSPDNLNAAANVVSAQLSDASGNFENPIVLGSLTTDESGTIEGTIPAGVQAGSGYRVRVVTTNYPMISEDNGTDLTITYPACTVTVSASPADGGVVSGGGTYDYGTEITVNAMANSGFLFVNWLLNGTQVSVEENYTFSVTENVDLVANFSEEGSYAVTVSATPEEAGQVSGAGNYTAESTVTVTTQPNEGYTFLYWTQNDNQVSTDLSYTFTLTENSNMVAHYDVNTYNISVSADPVIGGTVFGGGVFPYGEEITVHASAYPDYNFVGWTFNGETLSTEEDYSLVVLGDMQLIGHFVLKTTVAEQEQEFFQAYASNHQIVVTTVQQGEVCIYNLQGQLVLRTMVEKGKTVFAVPQSGLYFVRMNGISQKVMVL